VTKLLTDLEIPFTHMLQLEIPGTLINAWTAESIILLSEGKT
jgi:hypothetical protein